MTHSIAKVILLSSMLLVVAACSKGGDNSTTTPVPPPPPPPPATAPQDMFGTVFSDAYKADANAEPIDVKDGDLPAVDPAADPIDF